MVGHVKSRVLAHRLDLRDELADVSFLDKRIGQGDVERNGNSVIRDRIVAFLLHDFNEKIVLRENYIITAEAEFQRAFFFKLSHCGVSVKLGESLLDLSEMLAVLRTDGLELRLEAV